MLLSPLIPLLHRILVRAVVVTCRPLRMVVVEGLITPVVVAVQAILHILLEAPNIRVDLIIPEAITTTEVVAAAVVPVSVAAAREAVAIVRLQVEIANRLLRPVALDSVRSSTD